MGQFYDANTIVFKDDEAKYIPIWIDTKWEHQHYTPLHDAWYFQNQASFYDLGFHTVMEVKRGSFQCIKLFFLNEFNYIDGKEELWSLELS